MLFHQWPDISRCGAFRETLSAAQVFSFVPNVFAPQLPFCCFWIRSSGSLLKQWPCLYPLILRINSQWGKDLVWSSERLGRGGLTTVWMQCPERHGEEGGGLVSWNSTAVQCRQFEEPDPRYPPYTVVRITEAEMRAYHHFLGSCISLEYRAKEGNGGCAFAVIYPLCQ